MGQKFITGRRKTTRKNPDTGQIEEVEDFKVMAVKMKAEDEFYMVFIKYTAKFYGLKYADDIKVLAKMCEWGEFDRGVVYLTAGRRKEIRETLNIHNSNISNSLKRLKEQGFISGDDGEFLINPVIFWKGSKANRMEMMRKDGIQAIFNFTLEKDITPDMGIEPSKVFDK